MTGSIFLNAATAEKAPSGLENALRRLALPALPPSAPFDGSLAALVGLGLFALLLPTASTLLLGPDMQWHVRTGQEILASGRFPQTDPYSWTMAGHAWIAKEWLSQVFYALAFGAAGWTGAALLALAAASAAYALVFAALERRAGPLFALAAVLVVALAGNFHLLARPHVLAWPVAASFAIGLLDAAEQGRAPRWPFVLLMVLWANLHGSFLFGFILAPFFAWESLARARSGRVALAARWAGFVVACAVAVLIHPYGWRVLLAARDVLTLGPAMTQIVEWRPQNFSSFSHFEFILLLGFGAALLSGLRLPAPRVVLLLALLHSALAHVRQETLGLMIVALLLGAPVAALGAAIPRLPRDRLGIVAFSVLATLVAMSGMAWLRGPLVLPEELAPRAALAAARAAGVHGEVLNEDQFGGFLIGQRVPTYADSRAELFGPMHYDLSQALAGRKPETLSALLANEAIGWTILPTILPANKVLAASPNWRRVFSDDVATVFVRVN